MKKRAPTLPPTIIDRGLSMIAMRVTFSRACARARKKKWYYMRAQMRANARARKWRGNEKKLFLDTDTKGSELRDVLTTLKKNISFFSPPQNNTIRIKSENATNDNEWRDEERLWSSLRLRSSFSEDRKIRDRSIHIDRLFYSSTKHSQIDTL